MRLRGMLRKIFFVFLALILLFGSIFSIFVYQSKSDKGQFLGERVFRIKSGEDIWSVAGRLESDQLVASQWFFLWSAWRGELTGKVYAGDYVIRGGLTAPEVVHIFLSTKGKAEEVRITFPEGITMDRMAEILSSNQFDGDEFLQLAKNPLPKWRSTYVTLADLPEGASLEGFLFPATYTFLLTASPQEILETMLASFDRRFQEAGLLEETKRQGKSVFDMVIMASILEREIGNVGTGKQSWDDVARDRKIVSDIFWRRITDNHPLQSDATLAYTLEETKIQYSFKETRTESPYNSYINKGLPPGPISNPGEISLNAAFFSTPNDYYYFLNNPKTGTAFFAVTFEEHKQNKVKNGL